MRIYRNIVESESAPSVQDIWLRNGELLHFDGGWKSLKDSVQVINPPSGEAIISAPVIKLNNTSADKEHNLEVCSKLRTTEVISVDIEGTIAGTSYDTVGVYHNGTVSILEGNKVTVFDVNFDDGTITIDSKYDTSKLLSYVDLQIGDSESVKAYNKEHLPTGSFFVAIDYGFGTGTWNSSTGGQAHIVTASGNTVYYSIQADGAVTKILESPDIYYEYTQAGGTKSPIQFMLVLKHLIDS